MKKLDKHKEQLMKALYKQGVSLQAIADELGCSKKAIHDLRNRLKLPKRMNTQRAEYIPSLEDIQLETTKIKDSWTASERLRRSDGADNPVWDIPVVKTTTMSAVGKMRAV